MRRQEPATLAGLTADVRLEGTDTGVPPLTATQDLRIVSCPWLALPPSRASNGRGTGSGSDSKASPAPTISCKSRPTRPTGFRSRPICRPARRSRRSSPPRRTRRRDSSVSACIRRSARSRPQGCPPPSHARLQAAARASRASHNGEASVRQRAGMTGRRGWERPPSPARAGKFRNESAGRAVESATLPRIREGESRPDHRDTRHGPASRLPP